MKITLVYDQELKKFFFIPSKYIPIEEEYKVYKNNEDIKEDFNKKHDFLSILYYMPKTNFNYDEEGVFEIDKEIIKAIYNSYNQYSDGAEYITLKGDGVMVDLAFKIKKIKLKEKCLI